MKYFPSIIGLLTHCTTQTIISLQTLIVICEWYNNHLLIMLSNVKMVTLHVQYCIIFHTYQMKNSGVLNLTDPFYKVVTGTTTWKRPTDCF